MALTAKQEAFCQAIADGLSQADAYRLAYNAAKMKHETIQKRASELMKHGEVKGRVQELNSKLENKQLWTREQSVTTIMLGLQTAKTNNKPMEIFKGVELLNKMFGYDAPTKHDVDVKASINSRIIVVEAVAPKDYDNEATDTD